MRRKPNLDLSGKRFGSFIVLCLAGQDKHRQNVWLCLCDCGDHFSRTGSNILAVTRGTAVGRGCLKCANVATGIARTTHGETPRKIGKSTLYKRWRSMITRCTQPSYHGYRYYGGKGIKVCTAWQTFQGFRKWANANGFKDALTLDRLDAAGNYEPGNCEWVTMGENRRRMHVSNGHRVRTLH